MERCRAARRGGGSYALELGLLLVLLLSTASNGFRVPSLKVFGTRAAKTASSYGWVRAFGRLEATCGDAMHARLYSTCPLAAWLKKRTEHPLIQLINHSITAQSQGSARPDSGPLRGGRRRQQYRPGQGDGGSEHDGGTYPPDVFTCCVE